MFLYERFTGPCATNSLGKAFFDAADAAPPVHPDIKKINVCSGIGVGSQEAVHLLRRCF